MAELTLSQADIEELLTVLNVALMDSETAKRISRDLEMIDAVEVQQKRIKRWIHRLSQQVGSDK